MTNPNLEKTREERALEIAAGNDAFRKQLLLSILSHVNQMKPGDKVVMTQGMKTNSHLDEVIMAVANYKDFDPGDDPYGEHDFGVIKIEDERFYFKIDYWDKNLQFGVDHYEEEPTRVMTIMLAEEY